MLLGFAWVVTIEYETLRFETVPLSLLMSLCTDMHACCAISALHTAAYSSMYIQYMQGEEARYQRTSTCLTGLRFVHAISTAWHY